MPTFKSKKKSTQDMLMHHEHLVCYHLQMEDRNNGAVNVLDSSDTISDQFS